MYAALHLTHGCNLRCTYCYTGEKFGLHMELETALRSVDFLIDSAPGEFLTITLFGGEPLARYDVLREVVLHARRRVASGETNVSRVHFRMVTNGVLLDEEKLRFFREHDVLFSLSLDGNRAAQEANRPQAGGKSSFDLVMERVPRILEMFPYTSINMTIAPTSVGHVADSVEFLLETGFRYISAALAYNVPWTRQDLDDLAAQYRAVQDIYLRRHRAGEKFYFSLFDEKIKAHAQGPSVSSECCGIGLRKVSVAPSGRLYPCVQWVAEDGAKEAEHVLGDVFAGFDEARRDAFLAANHVPREQCDGCAFISRCSNYCGCTNYQATGDSARIPPALCEHERILIPLADEVAETLWKERNATFLRKIYDPTYPVASYIEDCMNREAS